MAGIERQRFSHRSAVADDGAAAGDGDGNRIAATVPLSDGDAASSHSHGAADQYAIAATYAVANAGTGDHRPNGDTDTTNRYRNCRAVANH